MAREAGWKLFGLSSHTVLTAAALLPMAVAGIEIEKVLQGAEEAQREYNIRSLENPLWQYAAVRNLMYRGGKAAELFVSWEPGFGAFGRWWQQLFAGAEGREGKGLLPVAVELPGETGGLAQMIRQGERNLLETMVRFAPPEQKHIIGSQWNDPDGLNHLEGTPLDRVEEQTYLETLDAHAESGVPVITMDCGELKEGTVGELFRFLELSCAISARVLGVVPQGQTEEEN
jgi:glucose-6-phosphate isomerase